jgi:aminopeptidase N
MTRLLGTILFLGSAFRILAQDNSGGDSSWKKIYRETATRINDIVNTRLDARFDFSKAYMNGKVWIILKPHFYATDSLTLDAKGMDIHKVALVKGSSMKELKYSYDGLQLKVNLNKLYKGGEQYTVYVDYTSKPDEVKIGDRGLYFINPRGLEKDIPTQMWTEGTSAWLPTIYQPNQKLTEEIYMTVPDKFVTLSNGKLASQKKNTDGTRTDYWKMDLPHSPYLFFMGIGEYAVIKDSWKGKEVSYYVEKEYALAARKIFGLTPEMIAFFSKITGVDYPWAKYAQIAGFAHEGSMENTTATLHPNSVQLDIRELTDGNSSEPVIAHELFHQWFGDYVTCESWSNVTLNESFATLGIVLWYEYKYGKDAGDEKNYAHLSWYLRDPMNAVKDLVGFYYPPAYDGVDVVYFKGSCILTMLRHYVGDSAFFKSINLYLTANKFKSAEAQNLRLAFEEVTGKDLNWFWNQWYYGSGHPELDINYSYDEVNKKVRVIVTQTQAGDKIFKLPVVIDVYYGTKKIGYQEWVKNKADTFSLNVTSKPDLVNFDGEKVLVAEKRENKTLDEYIYQYKYAGNYVDRREAIDFAAKNQNDPKAIAFLKLTLNDKYDRLRNYVITKLDLKNDNLKLAVEPILVELTKNGTNRIIKANAISKLALYKNPAYAPIFKAAINDSSYTVSGNALDALSEIDSADAFNEAKRLSSQPAKGKLSLVMMGILIKSGDESSANAILSSFEKMPISEQKFNSLQQIGDFLGRTKSIGIVKRGIDDIVTFRDLIPDASKSQADRFINGVLLKELVTKKENLGLQGQADYIKSKLPEEDKK